MPAKPTAGPSSPFAKAGGRIAKVSFDDIDGLHPAIARGRWLGAEYVLNDLSAITVPALAQVLRTHPVLLSEVVPGRKRRRRAENRGARDESTTGAGSAAATDTAAQAPDLGDDEDLQGGADDDVEDAGSESEAGSPAPGGATAAARRYVVVGGLRSWALASAVNARRLPGRCGKPLRIPALIVVTQKDEEVVTGVRAECYLDRLLYCLKPATASRQLAEDWKEFQEHASTELRRLTPALVSQEKLIAALGYTSRSAFRSRSKADADASSKDGRQGDAANSPGVKATASLKDLAAGTTEPSAPVDNAPEVDRPEERNPTLGQEDDRG